MKKHIGMYLKKIGEKLEKRANEARGADGITFSQGKVLFFLRKNANREVTLRDIEKFLDCSHATVSGLVSRLVEKGFVTLEVNSLDKRAKTVRLTEKEREYHLVVQRRREEQEKKFLAGFSDEEREQLLGYLERLDKNLEN
ncbi:MAG: MarR family transcriptional regulator [Clostridia bacterium]|nr:MarR family transcriptional regulator [Clostridia bacterium]